MYGRSCPVIEFGSGTYYGLPPVDLLPVRWVRPNHKIHCSLRRIRKSSYSKFPPVLRRQASFQVLYLPVNAGIIRPMLFIFFKAPYPGSDHYVLFKPFSNISYYPIMLLKKTDSYF